MVMCEVVTEQSEDEGIVIAPRWRIGSIIRATVSGRVRREAEVSQITYHEATDTDLGGFMVTLSNPGNIHLIDGEAYATELSAGSVLYFHRDLVHGSQTNRTKASRRVFVVAYQRGGLHRWNLDRKREVDMSRGRD